MECVKVKGDMIMKDKIIMLCGYIIAAVISAVALVGVVELSSMDTRQYSEVEC
jgi:hypothetical protein